MLASSLQEYNVSNGLLVRTFKKHPAEIAALCYCDKVRCVVMSGGARPCDSCELFACRVVW
jgi:hypothetical protein